MAEHHGNLKDVDICYEDEDGSHHYDPYQLKWTHVLILIGTFVIWPCCIWCPIYTHHEQLSEKIANEDNEYADESFDDSFDAQKPNSEDERL